MDKFNVEKIYKFIATLSLMREHLFYCKDDLIAIQKANIEAYIEESTDRRTKRYRKKQGDENLEAYIKAIANIYNSATKIIDGIEKTKEGSEMIDSMIDNLDEAINKIKIEVK